MVFRAGLDCVDNNVGRNLFNGVGNGAGVERGTLEAIFVTPVKIFEILLSKYFLIYTASRSG